MENRQPSIVGFSSETKKVVEGAFSARAPQATLHFWGSLCYFWVLFQSFKGHFGVFNPSSIDVLSGQRLDGFRFLVYQVHSSRETHLFPPKDTPSSMRPTKLVKSPPSLVSFFPLLCFKGSFKGHSVSRVSLSLFLLWFYLFKGHLGFGPRAPCGSPRSWVKNS